MDQDQWEYTIFDTVISAYRDSGNRVGEWLDNLNQVSAPADFLASLAPDDPRTPSQ